MIGLEAVVYFLTDQPKAVNVLGSRGSGGFYKKLTELCIGIVGIRSSNTAINRTDTGILGTQGTVLCVS